MRLALIPARGGSKRIFKKNIKLFYGKPLISYSIKAALDSKLFDKVIVSTDDAEIAKVAIKYGAEVPFIRPSNLSDDYSTTQDVIDHALKFFDEKSEVYNFVCTIYATAPFLQSKYLIEGYKNLKDSDAINAFSCTSMPFPIQRTFKVSSANRCEMFWPENFSKRSQDLEEAYQDAGQFYWNKVNQVNDDSKQQVLFSDISIPVVLPRYLVQDIDTLEDWKRAEIMYKALKETGEI